MDRRSLTRIVATALVVAALALPASAGGDLGDVGTFEKWARIEIVLNGPSASASGSPNPFGMPVDVEMSAPSGATWTIPGFYNGDGNGGGSGNVWMVRFSADETGTWTFRSSSSTPELDGYTGRFTVTAASDTAPGFYRWGRLEPVGTAADRQRYFKFRDGPFWMKAGCDDPENFLGGFSNYDTMAERRAAVDYLAARGVNSMYMLTHNVDGDNNDVFPWLGSNRDTARSNSAGEVRFDIPRLEGWLDLFEYMNEKGVAPYLILEDDSSWKGYDHDRYYREMIARFGHLPAVLFNIGEESTENYSISESLAWVAVLDDNDPYGHPKAIHNINRPNADYIDSPHLDFTAMQTKYTDALEHNDDSIDWINESIARGKRVVLPNFDEPRPLMDRKGWWSAYLGGGVWEVHVDQPYDRPMSAWEPAWTEVGGARAFMESTRFWEMNPANSLVTSGQAWCLAKPGEMYALYLPSGGSVTVSLAEGRTYRYGWWNPDNGRDGAFQNEGDVGGGSATFTAPGSGDWALRIVVTGGGGGNVRPVAHDSNAEAEAGGSTQIALPYDDPDGPGPYDFTIVEGPTQGTLSGTGGTRTYTANPDASGTDSFRWRVNDSIDDSNVATVTISIVAGGNRAPVALDQQVTLDQDTSTTIPLAYDDPDGPGPYSFAIVSEPMNGSVVLPNPGSNDAVYTPDPGYVGPDSFRWKVNDGLVDSNPGTVDLTVLPVLAEPPAPTGLRVK